MTTINTKNMILHVGFHKSGSTFIQNYFENHTDVFFSRKILADFIHDFRQEIPPFEQQTEQEHIFLSDMRLTVNSWGKTELERIENQSAATNVCEIQKEIAVKLKERFPSARILITHRSKDQLIPSLYSQYLLNGGTKSYHAFAKKSSDILMLFDYEYIIHLYSELFGSENTVVFSYDELKTDPEIFISKICTAFQIPVQPQELKVINPSLRKKSKINRRYINLFVHFSLKIVPKSRRNIYFRNYINRLILKH